MKLLKFFVYMAVLGSLLQISAEEAIAAPAVPVAKSVSIPFVENQGQSAPEVAFLGKVLGGTYFVTQEGRMVLELPGNADGKQATIVLAERLKGARKTQLQGLDPAVTRVSYFRGQSPKSWHTNLPSYNRISMGEVYDHINFELRYHGQGVEKLFYIRPKGNPEDIEIAVSGVQRISVLGTGELEHRLGSESITMSTPVAYQQIDGQRHMVEVSYRLTHDGYGFKVGQYDRRYSLVIDPMYQATYLGGNELEELTAVAVHPESGDVYVVGMTESTDFPATTDSLQPMPSAGREVFIGRLNADLRELHHATYLGGSGNDVGYAIAIDHRTNHIYISGETSSTDFPVTSGVVQSRNAGGVDAFVARLSNDLSHLDSSTYFGGSDNERAFGLGVSFAPIRDRVYITGDTLSDDLLHRTMSYEPAQADHAGSWDGFVASFTRDLHELRGATFLGGDGPEQALALAINPVNEKVVIVGNTLSENFPGTADHAQPNWGGSLDAFVSILTPDLYELRGSTYLGGDDADEATGVVIIPDSAEIYVSGFTGSRNFPATRGGYQSEFGGLIDMFVVHLDPGVISIRQSTYLGGSGNDGTHRASIAAHTASNTIYVAGYSSSSDFPGTIGGAQPEYAGGVDDSVVARLSSDLRELRQASYLGGGGPEYATGIAINSRTGGVYVAGRTGSSDLPNTEDGAQPDFHGGRDGFVAHFDLTLGEEARRSFILYWSFALLIILGVLVSL